MSNQSNSFMAVVDHKLARAERLIDEVDDHQAHRALRALFDVLDTVFSDIGTPQVIQLDPSMFEKKDKKDEHPEKVMVQTGKQETAGQKIAGKGGLYL